MSSISQQQRCKYHNQVAFSSHDKTPPPSHYSPNLAKKVHQFSFEYLPHGNRMFKQLPDLSRERRDIDQEINTECCGRLKRQYEERLLRNSVQISTKNPLPQLHQHSSVRSLKTINNTQKKFIEKKQSVPEIVFESKPSNIEISPEDEEQQNPEEVVNKSPKIKMRKSTCQRVYGKVISLEHSVNLEEYLHPNMNFVHGIGSKKLNGLTFEKYLDRPTIVNKLDNPNAKRFDPVSILLEQPSKTKRVSDYSFKHYTHRQEKLFEPTDMYGLDKLYDTSQKERFQFNNTGDKGSIPFQLVRSRTKLNN